MNYAEMSDAEINVAVAKIIFQNDQCITPYNHRPDVQIFHRNNCHSFFDYCNLWSDAGPIIQKNKIAIVPDGTEWVASTDTYFVDGAEWSIDGLWNDNPLRAAMIVFLMMKGGEQ